MRCGTKRPRVDGKEHKVSPSKQFQWFPYSPIFQPLLGQFYFGGNVKMQFKQFLVKTKPCIVLNTTNVLLSGYPEENCTVYSQYSQSERARDNSKNIKCFRFRLQFSCNAENQCNGTSLAVWFSGSRWWARIQHDFMDSWCWLHGSRLHGREFSVMTSLTYDVERASLRLAACVYLDYTSVDCEKRTILKTSKAK